MPYSLSFLFLHKLNNFLPSSRPHFHPELPRKRPPCSEETGNGPFWRNQLIVHFEFTCFCSCETKTGEWMNEVFYSSSSSSDRRPRMLLLFSSFVVLSLFGEWDDTLSVVCSLLRSTGFTSNPIPFKEQRKYKIQSTWQPRNYSI